MSDPNPQETGLLLLGLLLLALGLLGCAYLAREWETGREYPRQINPEVKP